MGVFAMPSLGADMEAGTLTEWLVKPGDTVKRGDIVAVVETQKGAIEIEIFEEGTVAELKAEVGQQLPVGAPLAVIAAEGESAAEQAATAPERTAEPVPQKPEPSLPLVSSKAQDAIPIPSDGSVAASPAARVRARELGVDLGRLTGSGPNGAILLSDVEKPGAPVSGPPAAKAPSSPMEEMRKAIAAAMARSKQTIPHFYVSETIDLQPAADWLAARNAERPPAERILMGALFVRATSLAAAVVHAVNGTYADGAFQPSGAVNTGVAIALRGGGLVAPALLDAEKLDLAETMLRMRELVGRARAGRLRSREMTAGTITVSSLGDGGSEAMAGVIFPPQVALVGIGSPQTRPWVVDGEVVPRVLVNVTLSADHRVSDGRAAAAFLEELRKRLARPEEL